MTLTAVEVANLRAASSRQHPSRLAEWPMLRSALVACGHDLPPSTQTGSREFRALLRSILRRLDS